MHKGIVKWFDETKGFGFIKSDDSGCDIFVHHTGINEEGFRTLIEGQRVTYTIVEGNRGPQAVNVIKEK